MSGTGRHDGVGRVLRKRGRRGQLRRQGSFGNHTSLGFFSIRCNRWFEYQKPTNIIYDGWSSVSGMNEDEVVNMRAPRCHQRAIVKNASGVERIRV